MFGTLITKETQTPYQSIFTAEHSREVVGPLRRVLNNAVTTLTIDYHELQDLHQVQLSRESHQSYGLGITYNIACGQGDIAAAGGS